MATNIEMNVKQESDYEVIYPQTICDMVINLLNPDTKALMGLEPTADADDAFRKIYLAQVLDGRALINFMVTGDDGTPCSGVQIESAQFCDSTGNKEPVIETDDEGKVSIFVDNISVQASISNYANLSDWSETIEVEFGKQYDKEITLTRYNFRSYTSSGNLIFSPDVVRVDVSLGAGGGGGVSRSLATKSSYGNGGAGGESIIQENISFEVKTTYSFQVGSGGQSSSQRDNGDDGGNTTFLTYSAKGGTGGQDNGQAFGNGNGGMKSIAFQPNNTRNGGNGTMYIYSSFNEQILYGGGGGGGVQLNSRSEEQIYNLGGEGGSPGGGKASDANFDATVQNNETTGKDGLGGGGAGCSFSFNYDDRNGHYSRGTRGGSGILAIRMYRQQDLT